MDSHPATRHAVGLGVVLTAARSTCRSCRSRIGIDDAKDDNLRLEALFVLSISLGLRPGELRRLTWDHVDLNRGVVHVWRSASKTGDTETPTAGLASAFAW
jgi:integrase